MRVFKHDDHSGIKKLVYDNGKTQRWIVIDKINKKAISDERRKRTNIFDLYELGFVEIEEVKNGLTSSFTP